MNLATNAAAAVQMARRQQVVAAAVITDIEDWFCTFGVCSMGGKSFYASFF
jgi:hypothetical protein